MISVIIPVYNSQKYLPRCIESVLRQNFSDIELILIDDGSSDNSLNLIEKYVKSDKRVQLIKQQHRSVSFARNSGLRVAKGDLIMFIDSDDYIAQNCLTTLVDLQKKSNADIIYTQPVSGKLSKASFDYKIFDRDIALKWFLNVKKFSGYSWGKLYRKKAINGLSFPENMTYGEDGVFSWNALMHSKKIVYSNQEFYHYNKRENSLTGRTSDYSEKNLNVFLQVDYIQSSIPKQLEKYFKVFKFAIYFNELIIYRRSSNEAKEKYHHQYKMMKDFCNSNWLNVLVTSINIRIKLLALKYCYIKYLHRDYDRNSLRG